METYTFLRQFADERAHAGDAVLVLVVARAFLEVAGSHACGRRCVPVLKNIRYHTCSFGEHGSPTPRLLAE